MIISEVWVAGKQQQSVTNYKKLQQSVTNYKRMLNENNKTISPSLTAPTKKKNELKKLDSFPLGIFIHFQVYFVYVCTQ